MLLLHHLRDIRYDMSRKWTIFWISKQIWMIAGACFTKKVKAYLSHLAGPRDLAVLIRLCSVCVYLTV